MSWTVSTVSTRSTRSEERRTAGTTSARGARSTRGARRETRGEPTASSRRACSLTSSSREPRSCRSLPTSRLFPHELPPISRVLREDRSPEASHDGPLVACSASRLASRSALEPIASTTHEPHDELPMDCDDCEPRCSGRVPRTDGEAGGPKQSTLAATLCLLIYVLRRLLICSPKRRKHKNFVRFVDTGVAFSKCK